MGKENFKSLYDYMMEKGEITPNQSGHQELFENVLNRYLFTD